jgi:hypothetical protein
VQENTGKIELDLEPDIHVCTVDSAIGNVS